MYVDCPDGVSAGDLLAVNTPSGETVEVVVPDDVAAGDQFEILLAVNAPNGEIVESAAPSEAREERPVADEDASAGQSSESVAQQSDDASTQSTKAASALADDTQKMHLLTLADAPKTKATKEPTSVAGPPRTTTVSMSALGAPKTGSGVAPSTTTTGRLPVEMDAEPPQGRDFILMIEENACCRARAKLKCRVATLDALIHHVTNRVNPSVSGPYALSMAGGVTPTQITRIEDVPGKAKVQLWQVSRFSAPDSAAAPGGAAKVRLSKRPPPPKR